MPVNTEEILNVCKILSETENLQVTITESLKGAGIIGAASFAGSMLGGSKGLLLGGVLGSIGAAVLGSGKYKSVTEIIRNDLTFEQKQKLASSVSAVIKDVQLEDAASLTAIALGNNSVKEAIIRELANFLKNEMGLAMINY